MSSKNRKLKNLLVDSNFQIKYAFYFASSGVAVMGLMFMFITKRINTLLMHMVSFSGQDLATEAAITSLLYDISLYTLIAFVINTVFSFCFALYMTHRVAGPARVIESYIGDIKNGNYESQRTLRKSDDLQSVMAALRDLCAHIKANTSSKQK